MSEEQKRVRLLLVDDSEETRASLAKIMQLEDEIEVVGQAANGRQALERARELRPDLVLMDVWMPEMDGILATEALTAELPFVQVVLMSVTGTSDLLRRAMLAGAREYLVKPFSSEELLACLQRVAAQGHSQAVADWPEAPQARSAQAVPQRGQLIAVAGAKGGVGRTMIACNLAAELARTSSGPVALVDGCLRAGDVALALNLAGGRSLADLVSLAPEEIDLAVIDDVLTSHPCGLRALLAPTSPFDAEGISADHFQRVLAQLVGVYSYVVVDMSAALLESDLVTLQMADKIVLLYTLELAAMRGLRHHQDALGIRRNEPGRLVPVANRMDAPGGMQLKDVERSLRIETALGLPTDVRLATYSLNKGQPLVLTHPKSALALSIMDLAELVQALPSQAVGGNSAAVASKGGALGAVRSKKAS